MAHQASKGGTFRFSIISKAQLHGARLVTIVVVIFNFFMDVTVLSNHLEKNNTLQPNKI